MTLNLTIVLELALGGGSISLWNGEEAVEIIRPDTNSSRSEDVLEHIHKLLAKQGFAVRQVDRVVCSKGPGGYTGIRVGLATALGLRRAVGLEVLAYSTTAALLSAFETNKTSGAVIDAGRAEYVFAYRSPGKSGEIIAPVSEIADAAEEFGVEIVAASVRNVAEIRLAFEERQIGFTDASDNVNELLFRCARDHPDLGFDLNPEYGRDFKSSRKDHS